MMRVFFICLILASQLALPGVSQQEVSSGEPTAATCTFDDGKQMKVQYDNSPANGETKLRSGKPWEPGASLTILFTQTALTVGSVLVPDGAYSLYFIPEKRSWTLVVNRNVTTGSKYDEKQDVARAPMQIGEIEHAAKQPEILFAHGAPKECNLRVYYEKTGAWADIQER